MVKLLNFNFGKLKRICLNPNMRVGHRLKASNFGYVLVNYSENLRTLIETKFLAKLSKSLNRSRNSWNHSWNEFRDGLPTCHKRRIETKNTFKSNLLWS